MGKAENENEKAELYDQYIAQKYLDELPKKNTLKLKISSALACVVRDWQDNTTEEEMQKKNASDIELMKR